MPHNNPPLIRKASGELEPFDINKLKFSLKKTGISDELLNSILYETSDWIVNGISTKQVYEHAFKYLNKTPNYVLHLYKLKQALFDIGPTGYPFESLMGELFTKQGYETEVGIVVDGRSVTHEMDVIATNKEYQHIVECKYSKDQGKVISIQVPLYVRSRVNDIIAHRKELNQYKGLDFQAWVATNTRFSSDSIQYAKLNDISLIAWDYPKGAGLKELLEEYKVFPISILHNLENRHKDKLLKQGIVTVSQLLKKLEVVHTLNIDDKSIAMLLEELDELDN